MTKRKSEKNTNPAPEFQEPVPVTEENTDPKSGEAPDQTPKKNLPKTREKDFGKGSEKQSDKNPEKNSEGISEKIPEEKSETKEKPEQETNKSAEEAEKPSEAEIKEIALSSAESANKAAESAAEPLSGKKPRSGRKITGRLMMVLGILLILSAVLLYVYNQMEDREAGKAAAQMLPQVQEEIVKKVRQQAEALTEPTAPSAPEHVNPYNQEQVETSTEMTVWTHNGWNYIGYLYVPTLELELPVLSKLSQYNLGMAPCRHQGSTKSDDLVIAAHNYSFHFGRLRELNPGDPISFVDMDGVLSEYEVVAVSVIGPDDIDLVTDPSLDLSLYTCTYGGQNRVMVGCQRIKG